MSTTTLSRLVFDGPIGLVSAREMARGSADLEHEAAALLDPAADDKVLTIGCGPGVGIDALLARARDGWVAAVDPSWAMIRAARRRHRDAIAAGRVTLARTDAARLPWPDAIFQRHAVISVRRT